ncbi:methionine ABC transporter permease [Leucobacter celer]|jgi:D-methionine transport system permease protein|uniref:methionine ABC transporter permease n=1 Tax=Leucobacter celer TaxID=668625 RepID=UPI0006A7796F|nr:methionine ABC transporter permease [Leucobacter celer]
MDAVIEFLPKVLVATGETLLYVAVALLIGGLLGLIIGVSIVVTRKGGLTPNQPVYWLLNVLVNFFRPIPFLILMVALQPLARIVVGTGIQSPAFMFVLSFAATFGIARLVEQNLLTVDPGVIEAARAMGAGPLRIILTVLIPEGLGPLILGYTFAFIAIVDMSALAGIIGGGGLGNLALQYGFRQFNPWITWGTVLVMVIIVQLAQVVGNALARKVLRR